MPLTSVLVAGVRFELTTYGLWARWATTALPHNFKKPQPPFQSEDMLSANLDPVPVSSGRSLVAPASVRVFLNPTWDSNPPPFAHHCYGDSNTATKGWPQSSKSRETNLQAFHFPHCFTLYYYFNPNKAFSSPGRGIGFKINHHNSQICSLDNSFSVVIKMNGTLSDRSTKHLLGSGGGVRTHDL